MLDVFTGVVFAGACVFTFAWVVLAQRRTIKRLSDAYLRLTHFQRVVVALAVIVCTVYAQKPSTNDVNGVSGTNQVEIVEGGGTNGVDGTSGEAVSSPLLLGFLRPLTSGQESASPFSAPYRLESVSTNEGYSYAMPAGGTIRGTWHLTGAYEDVQKVTLDGFVFPLGSDLCTSLWAYTWGKVRPQHRNASNEIVAVGAPMSAIPDVSRFWTASTSNDTYLLTWENFAAGRLQAPRSEDAVGTVNAQIELFRSGDFITRSNDVEKVYRRVDPDDWDGDGWRNDDDPDPYSRDEFYDDFCQELPDGANEDAYCWIDVRPRWNSDIWFYGDAPSNLDDPYICGKAGVTYRVQLLIGKAYFIESTQPLDVVGQSNPLIEIDGNGTCEIDVVWPVGFSALESNGGGFRMVVRPSGLGGFFNWTDSCCTIYGSHLVFRYGCSGNCGCSGCYASGYYEYEGYRLEMTGGWCGCSQDDDDPGEAPDDPPSVGVSVSFSKRAIIFEDSYANTTNDIVPWNSTATELACTINGGPNGGYVHIDISGGDNLIQYTGYSLPYSRTLAPNERIEFTNRYKATVESSSEDDIEVTATFVENETGWVDESEAKATAVRVKIEPAELAPENESIERHKYGVCESVDCTQSPSSPQINWVTTAGTIETRFGGRQFKCPIYAAMNPLKAMCGGAEYTPVISIVEPNSVEARDAGYDCFNAPYGEAGSIALKLKLYIGPFDVNFAGVRVEEVPNNNGYATGYFNRQDLQLWWSHTRGNGAGIWLPVTEGNKMGGQNVYDQAGLTNVLSRVNSFGMFVDDPNCLWSDGSIIMPNPFGWNKDSTSGETPPHDTFAESTIDIVEIRFDGRCRIWKLGNEVIRYPSGAVYLNGGFQQ